MTTSSAPPASTSRSAWLSDLLPRPQFSDLVAGASVAMVLIPQSVAYASLAGMPAQIGLFASALPLIVFSLFASSPYLQSGPTAVTSLLTFAALKGTGLPTETAEYVKAGAMLAVLVAGIRLLLGLLRLGKVAFAVAEPVMVGFTSGAAIIIFSTQLHKVVGVVPPDGKPLSRAWWTVQHIGDWQILAILIAVGTLACMLGGKKISPLFPGVLVAVVIGLVVSIIVGLDGRWDRAIAGDPQEIPGGFPSLGLDLPWGSVSSVLIGAVIIAVVGFAEPSAIARTYANEEQETWDASREFAASGAANFMAAVSSAYPVGGSFSRSSVNKLAGAKTRAAGGITGLVVLAFLPLAPLLNDLPTAVLGAIVIGAVLSLMKPVRLYRMWARSKSQAMISYLTLMATVFFAPEVYYGIAVGFGLTILHYFLKPVRVMVSDDGQTLSTDGMVWLASGRTFDQQLDAALQHTSGDVRLDLSKTPAVDSGMAESIADASVTLAANQRTLTVTNPPAGSQELISSLIALRS